MHFVKLYCQTRTEKRYSINKIKKGKIFISSNRREIISIESKNEETFPGVKKR